MATYSSIFIPGPGQAITFNVPATSAASSNTTAGNANYLGFNRIIAIQPNTSMTIAFFNSNSTSPATANATSWPLVAGGVTEWDTGSAYDSVSLFNTTASNANVSIWPLSKI